MGYKKYGHMKVQVLKKIWTNEGPWKKTQKDSVDAKINTLESDGTVRQVSESRPSVPVNLTCKLTRNR